ncbi:MAG: M36 family metallopeptidase [Planctomycetota bacterium]|nr:M36 family metallopeptidase [Planctomycetota bacterium]
MQGMSSTWRRASGPMGLTCGMTAAALLALSGTSLASPPKGGDEVLGDHTPDVHLNGERFFDIRQTQNELPSEAVEASLRAYRASEAWQRREAALATLAARVPQLRSDDHHLFGTPHFVRSTAAFLSGPSNAAPVEVVKSFLLEQADLFGLSAADLDAAMVARDFSTHGIMHHVTLQQAIGGVKVYGNILRANVTARGEIINVSSSIVPEPAEGWNVPAATIEAGDAIRLAARDAGVYVSGAITPNESVGASEKTTWTVGPEFDTWTPVTTERVYFATTRDTMRPAFHVVIPTPGVGHTYDVILDAISGEVLWRHNWLCNDTTQPVTYRVYTSDSPAPYTPGPSSPDGSQAPFVPRQLVTVQPADIIAFSPNGWIPDGGDTTTGNNVDAYLDRDGTSNTPDPNGRPISAARLFDLPIAVDGANVITEIPTNYSLATVTQGFYTANSYHDRLWAMGFDEPAGNYQADNFGRGGVQGDYVRMEMQDGSGTNNANWSSSTDGSTARCQMYLWTPPALDRDGGLDVDIIYHELTHGLSIRCHEATLTGTQARSMGEGWGDFFGVCLSAEPSDDLFGTYTTGGFATLNLWAGNETNNYYYGIRRYPYSADFTKNPHTFLDISSFTPAAGVPWNSGPGTSTASVHNNGEMWCTTLITARYRMSLDSGFAANERIMQLVVDGMKLAPANPNYLQQRDAILQSDLVRYGGANTARLWEAFASRGMGFSATSPTGGSTSGIVEAFDVPQRVTFSYPDGLPTQLQPNTPTSFTVTMSPQLLTITPNTQQLFISVDGGAFTPRPLVSTGGDSYTATIPGAGCFADVRYYVSTNTNAGVRTDPVDAPASSYAATVFSSTLEPINDTMETDTGWVVGPNTATTGNWNRMDPQGTTAQPEDDTTPSPGVNCWVTDGNAGTGVGTFDIDGGFTQLTSPVFDMSSPGDFQIQYQRWYSNNVSTTYGDPWLVQISNNNGSTWVTFESIPVGAPVQNGWVTVSRSLSSLGLTGTSQMRLRFRAEDSGTASIVEAAIDDLRVFRRLCDDSVPCNPDINADGNVDQDDIACLAQVIAGNSGCADASIDPDFNGDGNADQDDVAALEQVVGGQPCP